MTSVSQKTTITRIEFRLYPAHKGAVQVSKYEDGWTAGSNPVERSLQTEQTLDDMLAWLAERRWTIYRWSASKELGVAAGATAFRGRPQPKRTKAAILELRRELERKSQAYYNRYTEPLPIQINAIDLAYEL